MAGSAKSDPLNTRQPDRSSSLRVATLNLAGDAGRAPAARLASRRVAFEAADLGAPLEPLHALRANIVVRALRLAARSASQRVAFEAADLGADFAPTEHRMRQNVIKSVKKACK